MALEYNDWGNAPRANPLRVACEARGIGFAIWMTRGFSAAEARQATVESGARGFIAEGEVPAEFTNGAPNPQAQNWPELAWELEGLDGVQKAVATSWAPFQRWEQTALGPKLLPAPEKAKALIEARWHCMPYVYTAENPSDNIPEKVAYARHFTHERAPSVLGPGEGWYEIEPVLGTYGGFELEDFPERDECIAWSAWDAGELF